MVARKWGKGWEEIQGDGPKGASWFWYWQSKICKWKHSFYNSWIVYLYSKMPTYEQVSFGEHIC